jgi:hypothetical protein
MPFIQTCLAQSQRASPKATTLYVYNMSPFLVACLLNRWQTHYGAVQAPPPPPEYSEYLLLLVLVLVRGTRGLVLILGLVLFQKKARGLTTPRSSKPASPDGTDVIVAEIKVRQRCALRQHSCKPLCHSIADEIEAEIEVSQRCALRQHSCKTLCHVWSELIAVEIEVSERCAVRQHSC